MAIGCCDGSWTRNADRCATSTMHDALHQRRALSPFGHRCAGRETADYAVRLQKSHGVSCTGLHRICRPRVAQRRDTNAKRNLPALSTNAGLRTFHRTAMDLQSRQFHPARRGLALCTPAARRTSLQRSCCCGFSHPHTHTGSRSKIGFRLNLCGPLLTSPQ